MRERFSRKLHRKTFVFFANMGDARGFRTKGLEGVWPTGGCGSRASRARITLAALCAFRNDCFAFANAKFVSKTKQLGSEQHCFYMCTKVFLIH